MRDLVSSCAAGKMNDQLILDLGDYEDKEGDTDVPVAWMPKLNQITLLQMDGMITRDELESCVKLAIEGCKQISEIQREALKAKYGMSEGDTPSDDKVEVENIDSEDESDDEPEEPQEEE
jgi:exosome complex component RRP41